MAFTTQELQAGFLIGECLVEPRTNRIVRGESVAHVEPRVMDVLVCLAEQAGEVISRETLNQRVWAHVVVTDQAVTNCISELRQHLGDDRATNRVIETIPKRGYRLAIPVRLAQNGAAPAAAAQSVAAPSEPAQPAAGSSTRRRWPIAAGVLLVAGLAGFAWWWQNRKSEPALTSVAVLQFENAAGDTSLDYLGLALPDEIATLLTQSRGVAVRPLGYVDAAEPLAAARERRVDNIVSGRYYLEDSGQLSLAIEAQDVPQERVIWRTRISVPVGDLLVMRQHLAKGVRSGLLPALGARVSPASGSIPTDSEAYQLYLRSLATPQQPKQNERAIEMLEKVVELEPDFAPAWHALGVRYYDYGTWWGGGEAARRQSVAAHRKALALDPDLISAARNIITNQTETGDFEGAYREARRLMDRFGPGAETHFTLSYIMRYGGHFEESQRQCELARARDPQSPRLRSCAYSYLYAGKLPRVMEYLMLDEGSYFVHWGTVLYSLRLNDRDTALHVVRQAAEEPTRGLMEPCLAGKRGSDLDAPAAEFMRHWGSTTDPENPFAVAPILVYCDRPRDALQFLERAVDLGFCVYPYVDLDPIWASLRNDAEFQRIRGKGQVCHERFRRSVAAVDAERA